MPTQVMSTMKKAVAHIATNVDRNSLGEIGSASLPGILMIRETATDVAHNYQGCSKSRMEAGDRGAKQCG